MKESSQEYFQMYRLPKRSNHSALAHPSKLSKEKSIMIINKPQGQNQLQNHAVNRE
jgi:hypothetical protein